MSQIILRKIDAAETLDALYALVADIRRNYKHDQQVRRTWLEARRAIRICGQLSYEQSQFMSALMRPSKMSLSQQRALHAKRFGRYAADWRITEAIEHLERCNFAGGQSAAAQRIREKWNNERDE